MPFKFWFYRLNEAQNNQTLCVVLYFLHVSGISQPEITAEKLKHCVHQVKTGGILCIYFDVSRITLKALT